MFSVNYLAVITSAVLSMLIGGLWFSPFLFVKPWLKLIGKTEKELKAASTPQKMLTWYGTAFVLSLLFAYIMAYFEHITNTHSVSDGLKLGFIAWLGFIFTSQAPVYLFEGRPMKLFAINAGHIFLVIMVVAAVLSVWR